MTPLRESFTDALARLEEVLAQPVTDIVRDAAIQRFEFCFELGWKVIQQQLRAQGLDCASPRSCLRAALRQGWIANESAWLAILEDRNRTSHTYDRAIAIDVFSRLSDHLSSLLALRNALPEP